MTEEEGRFGLVDELFGERMRDLLEKSGRQVRQELGLVLCRNRIVVKGIVKNVGEFPRKNNKSKGELEN